MGFPIYGGLFYLLGQWLPFEDWTGGWIFLGWSFLSGYLGFAVTVAVNPEVLNARARGRREGLGWDRALVAALVVILVVHFALAVLDAGIYWWAPLPPWWALAGLALAIPGAALSIWALCTNRHFEPWVRLQHDRDHRVVSDGPYRFIRHPGYLGIFLYCLSSPLILGSGWCFVTGAAGALVIVARTAWEDGFLQEGLAGYREYSDKVRYRLIPGLW